MSQLSTTGVGTAWSLFQERSSLPSLLEWLNANWMESSLLPVLAALPAVFYAALLLALVLQFPVALLAQLVHVVQ